MRGVPVSGQPAALARASGQPGTHVAHSARGRVDRAESQPTAFSGRQS